MRLDDAYGPHANAARGCVTTEGDDTTGRRPSTGRPWVNTLQGDSTHELPGEGRDPEMLQLPLPRWQAPSSSGQLSALAGKIHARLVKDLSGEARWLRCSPGSLDVCACVTNPSRRYGQTPCNTPAGTWCMFRALQGHASSRSRPIAGLSRLGRREKERRLYMCCALVSRGSPPPSTCRSLSEDTIEAPDACTRIFVPDGLSRAQRQGKACASCRKRWPVPRTTIGQLTTGGNIFVCDDCATAISLLVEPITSNSHASDRVRGTADWVR